MDTRHERLNAMIVSSRTLSDTLVEQYIGNPLPSRAEIYIVRTNGTRNRSNAHYRRTVDRTSDGKEKLKRNVMEDRHEQWTDEELETSDWWKTLEKKVVFVVYVKWSRGGNETRTLSEEYATVKAKLPEGTGLFIGYNEVLGERKCDAVVVLRGRLATIGDLKRWFEVECSSSRWTLLEPKTEWKLEDFLRIAQDYCGRGGLTCGRRIKVERGDAETLTLLERLAKRKRYEAEDGRVEALTRKMEWRQMTDSKKVQVLQEWATGEEGEDDVREYLETVGWRAGG